MPALIAVLYFLAGACVTAGLLLLSPPLALVFFGLLLGRVAVVLDKGGDA